MKEVKIVNQSSNYIPEILGVSKSYEAFIDDYISTLDGSDKTLSSAICEVANEAENITDAVYGSYIIGQFMGQKLI